MNHLSIPERAKLFPLAENSSSPVPATSVTAAEKQMSTGKETVSSEENGSDKESPHCEDGNLPDR